MKKFFAIFLFLFLCNCGGEEHNEGEPMLSQGPNNCGTCANDAGTGTDDWLHYPTGVALNGTEVQAADVNNAASPTITTGSKYLKCTNFGFNIPPTAVIRGILVEADIQESTLASDAFDTAVRIVKGGVVKTTDRSNGTEWPTALTYRSYGGSTDLWGETWTPADINASNFGYAHAANSVAGFGKFLIEHVRITVYYDLPGDLGIPF